MQWIGGWNSNQRLSCCWIVLNGFANGTELFQRPSLRQPIFFLWSQSLPGCLCPLPALLIDEYYLEDKPRQEQTHPKGWNTAQCFLFRKEAFFSTCILSCQATDIYRRVPAAFDTKMITFYVWILISLALFYFHSFWLPLLVQAPVAEMPDITNDISLPRLSLWKQ